MPTYEYICDNCQYFLSENLPLSEFKKRIKCPRCKKRSLVYQYQIHSRVIGNTLGSLADKNTAKMGHYEREERIKSDIDTGKIQDPAKSKALKRARKMHNMTNAQKEKYIYTGELPLHVRD